MKATTKLSVRNLIAAARKGDIAKIRACLEGGVDVNGVHVLHGIICECALGAAASEGRVEAIKVLLQHGANPNPQFLINPLHQIHPLAWAATMGQNIEAVRLLLEAGVDVNRVGDDGETVLGSPFIQNNKPMIALLKKFGAKTGGSLGTTAASKPRRWDTSPIEETNEEFDVDLTKDAARSSFSKFVGDVSKSMGVVAGSVKSAPGACSFEVSQKRANRLLQTYYQAARDKGFFLFRANTSESEGVHRMILLPISDHYVALRIMQTNGTNCGLSPDNIIKWLKKLETRYPFELHGIGYDFLEGRFLEPIKTPKPLANELYEFCPDIVDQGTETVQRLASELKKNGTLFLWWD